MDGSDLGLGERPTGGESDGSVFNSQRAKSVGVLLGFLALFFLALVAVSYL